MLITRKQEMPLKDYCAFLESCIDGGVTSVQLREKHLSPANLYELAHALQAFLSARSIPLIINDFADLAHEVDAAGVHLGQQDGDPTVARQKLGTNKLIGLTVNRFDQFKAANTQPIDYIGFGAIFSTRNKQKVTHTHGLDGLIKAVELSQHKIVAIGGITKPHVKEIYAAGAHGIAAIDLFHH